MPIRPIVVALVLLPLAVRADTVDELRESVNPPWSPPAAPAPPKEKKSWHWEDPKEKCDDCDCDDHTVTDPSLFLAAAVVTGSVVSSPFWLPATLVDDGRQRVGWFTHHPYQYGDSYMKFEHPQETEEWSPATWSLRLESDFGTNFNHQQLLGGHLLWEHANRFGLETRASFLEDDFGTARDNLWFGDLNGTYRFAQSEHWLFRGGVGLNWLADHGDEDLGINLTYQIDWFPVDPLVFSTDLDYGTLGDATLFHFQQTAGVTWHGIEARVGYDYLDVGPSKFSLFLCGIRGWF